MFNIILTAYLISAITAILCVVFDINARSGPILRWGAGILLSPFIITLFIMLAPVFIPLSIKEGIERRRLERLSAPKCHWCGNIADKDIRVKPEIGGYSYYWCEKCRDKIAGKKDTGENNE